MERLTIDEIIGHCKRQTDGHERRMSAEQYETADMNNFFVQEYWEHRQVAEYLEELKEYRKAEEQGLLLRLPCKVGDTVWQIHTIPKSNRKIIAEVVADAFFIALCVLEGRFGKKVFLTKEEAESALAEKGGAE